MTETRLPASLLLVGAGKMGGAMLEGWLAAGLEPGAVTILDPHLAPERAAACRARGISTEGAEPRPVEAVVLAIKPQSLDEAAPGLRAWIGPGTLLLSLLAGKTIADLRRRLPETGAVVRAMPNLAASVGRGATGAVASPEVSEAQRRTADRLLASVGVTAWVEEEGLIDAVTALSGSGPAYVFHLVEALAEAGTAAGLPPALAQRLARATVEGAGELLRQSPLSPAELRRDVTSPGGTTAAGLAVLMPALPGLLRETVAAARRRAGELSG